MSLVGKGEHLLVAPTVAKSLNGILGTVEGRNVRGRNITRQYCQSLFDAVHFFFAIAVVGLETAREPAVHHLDLRTQHLDALQSSYLKEGAHPVIDAGTHDEHLLSCCQCLVNPLDALRAQQVLLLLGKGMTKFVEFLDAHTLKEMGKDTLLCLPVGIEVELHQHQQGAVHKEYHEEAAPALGKLDERQQGIGSSKRSVEIEAIYFFLHLTT